MAAGQGLTGRVRRCAVIGSPIRHSLSPALHRAGYAAVGLDWEFEAHEVDVPGLPGFVASLGSEWRGLAVTMPLKQALLALSDEVDPVAAAVGGGNTLLLEPGGRRTVHNTDVPGMANALAERGVTGVPRAVVLGGGATARSAVAAIAEIAGEVDVFVRNPARSGDLTQVAKEYGLPLRVLPWESAGQALDAPLVIATTPAGALDSLAAGVPAAGLGVLFDVVYDPWPTALAAAWQGRDGKVLSGLDLLVHQAVLQFRLMTGYDVAVEVLRRAGLAEVGE